ncbi:MAG: AAA family ATPase, partial [Sediminibacterium sp.]|nr:AAA family ATPase [Sediminibacterium sp.]
MKLPLGRQDFASLIQDGCVYIDKTETIGNLVTNLKYVFLSRPRRFGKSLTISTLDYLFQGKKALFKGLWIYDHWNWKENYPVIRIDFSAMDMKNLGLENEIVRILSKIATDNKIKLTANSYRNCFEELIIKLVEKYAQKVVILIDEYDAPIVNYIDVDSSKMIKAQENREVLREFYKVLKSNDGYIRSFMFTGITRVVKMNLFSALNNVKDISFSNEYATLTGYTEKEVLHYFTDKINNIQQQEFPNLNFQQLIDKIRYWYNGYNFGGKETIYNPYTFLNFIFDKEFKSFWIGTGESSLLIKTFQENNFNSLTFLNKVVNIQEDFNIEKLNPITLLYQTGYIT